MDTDDGWPQVWAEMNDEELRDRLRHYLFLGEPNVISIWVIELQILLRLTPEYKATRVRAAAAPILQSINTFPTSNGRGTVRIERLRNPFSVLVPIIRGSCRSKMSRKDWLVRARRNLLGT